MQRFRGFKGFLFLILFLPVLVNAITVNDLMGKEYQNIENPSPEDLNNYINDKAKVNDIPPIILKAILLQEGLPNYKWQQFNEESQTNDTLTIVRHADKLPNSNTIKSYGLGLFQITYSINYSDCEKDDKKDCPLGLFFKTNNGEEFKSLDDEKVQEVKNIVQNWEDNVDKGIEILKNKWKTNLIDGTTQEQIINGDDANSLILENWYLPIKFYNNSDDYAKKAYRIIRNGKIDNGQFVLDSMLAGNTDIRQYYNKVNISYPLNKTYSTIETIKLYTLEDIVENGGKLHIWNQDDDSYDIYNLKYSSTNLCKNYKNIKDEEFTPIIDKDGKIHEYGKIHEWGETNIWLQNCENKNKEEKLVFLSQDDSETFLVELGFMEAYRKKENNFGTLFLGRPIEEPKGKDYEEESRKFELQINGMELTGCQRFEKGLLLWDTIKQDSLHILNSDTECTAKSIEQYKTEISNDFDMVQDFSDVPLTHTNFMAIKFVKEKGIVNGYNDGTFRPEDPINRAEFTKIVLLSKYAPEEIKKANGQDFTDINDGDWYKDYANFAKHKGFIRGYEQLDETFKFGGNQNIKFAEAAKIIVNVLIEETESATEGDWFTPFITKLTEKNVQTYDAEKNITRGEMAQIISKVLKDAE